MKKLEFAVCGKQGETMKKGTLRRSLTVLVIAIALAFEGSTTLTGTRALRSAFANNERTDAARGLFKGLFGKEIKPDVYIITDGKKQSGLQRKCKVYPTKPGLDDLSVVERFNYAHVHHHGRRSGLGRVIHGARRGQDFNITQ